VALVEGATRTSDAINARSDAMNSEQVAGADPKGGKHDGERSCMRYGGR
jgi:hypothetical protein